MQRVDATHQASPRKKTHSYELTENVVVKKISVLLFFCLPSFHYNLATGVAPWRVMSPDGEVPPMMNALWLLLVMAMISLSLPGTH